MAMTFGSFVSREDAGYSDGDPTVEINEAGAYKLDGIQEDIGMVQQEMIEHESAEETLDEMKEELEQAAVNYADAAGIEKPSEVQIDGETVVTVDGDTESEIEKEGASDEEVEEQVAEKTAELDITVENLMGKLVKKYAASGKEMFNVYAKRPKVDLQSIRANPLEAYSNSIEELGETIKNAGKRLKEWLMKIWEAIRRNIAKIIPYFKNFREKGEAMVKRAKAIKRPELVNDEKGDWSERFIFVNLFLEKNSISDFIDKTRPEKNIQEVNDAFKVTSTSVNWKGVIENIVSSKPKIQSLRDMSAYSVADSNKSYSGDEIYMLSVPTYDLTVQGVSTDNWDEYKKYIGSNDDDDKTVKLEIGSYRFQIAENDGKKKKLEEKIPARDLVDLAIKVGDALQQVGRYEESLKKSDDSMKKLLERVEKLESEGRQTANPRAKDDLAKVIKAVMNNYNSIGSFPKLLYSVGNEALAAVKDGDKE